MKIRVTGNTTKVNPADPKTGLRKVQNGDRTDSVFSFWLCEKIKKRDGSEESTWSKVTLWRNYAETIARQLGENNSRKCMVTGTGKAKFYTNKQGQIIPYIDIQADDLEWMDEKYPKGETPLDNVPGQTPAEAPAVDLSAATAVTEDDMPW